MRVMSSDAEECGRLSVAMGTKGCQEYLMSSFGTEGRMLTVETLQGGQESQESSLGIQRCRVSLLVVV